jgi:hypothetical protein
MPPDYVLQARANFVAWLRWYMAMYPEKAPTEAALARLLGIAKSTLHAIMAKDSQSCPSFETLLTAAKVLDTPVAALLRESPKIPQIPQK